MNLPINQIILGDCLEVMKGMPDKSVDLVLTDPPYGINADKGSAARFGSSTHLVKKYKGGWDSSTPPIEYFTEMLRVGKKVIIFGGQFFADKLPVNGHWIVWDKKGDIQFDNPFGDCELAWTNIERKSVKKYTVIQQGFITEDESPRLHATQKPDVLMSKILQDYSEENDLILDPFAGSCTTLIACKQLNRRCICIEKEEDYVKICHERLDKSTDNLF